VDRHALRLLAPDGGQRTVGGTVPALLDIRLDLPVPHQEQARGPGLVIRHRALGRLDAAVSARAVADSGADSGSGKEAAVAETGVP
jgi:hypothetical protein